MVADVVEHLQRVVEVVLVGSSVAHLHALEGCQFGEYERQQTASAQLHQSDAGCGCEHYLVELIYDALL